MSCTIAPVAASIATRPCLSSACATLRLVDSPTVSHRSVPSRAHGFTLVRAHVGSPGRPCSVCPHAPAWLHVVELILNGARLCTETPRRVRAYAPRASRACMGYVHGYVHEYVYGCVDGYVDGYVHEYVYGCMDGYAMCTSMHVCRYPCMCTDTDAWMDACKWVSWWMDAWMDARMHSVRAWCARAWCVRGCLIT